MVLGLADEARVRVHNPGPDRDEDLHQVRLVLKRLRSRFMEASGLSTF